MTLEPSTRDDWLVWTWTMTDWQPLASVLELLEPIDRDPTGFPPPVPKTSIVASQSKRIRKESSLSFVDREYKRMKRVLTISIRIGKNYFESSTVNISEGGLLLKEPLPDWVIGYFQVHVLCVENGAACDLTASLVDNQQPHCRFRLQFADPAGSKPLQNFQKVIAA